MNTFPPGGSNSSNAQPKRKVTRGSGGRKKKRTAEFDYDDYDSVIDCIENYKANIVDLETKVTQLKEQGENTKQHHKNGEFVSFSHNRKPSHLLTFIYFQQWRQQSKDTQAAEQPQSLEDEVERCC